MDELSPPGQPRYEQLADKLRKRIFDEEWPDDASGPHFAVEYHVSQTAAQKAFEILEREGLVQKEAGRRTGLRERLWWQVEASVRGDVEAAQVASRVIAEVRADYPAVRDVQVVHAGVMVTVMAVVESAHAGGAVALALPLAEHALGGAQVRHLTAYEVDAGASVSARPT